MLNLIIAVLLCCSCFLFHSLSSIEGLNYYSFRKIIRVVGTY